MRNNFRLYAYKQQQKQQPRYNEEETIDCFSLLSIFFNCRRLKCRKLAVICVSLFCVVTMVTVLTRALSDDENSSEGDGDWLKSYEISIRDRPYSYSFERNLSNSTDSDSINLLKSYNNSFLNLPLCPEVPSALEGSINFNVDLESEDLFNLEPNVVLKEALINSTVREGGWWQPVGCKPRHHVIVIIPYRDRELHLAILLSYMHIILQRQQLDYRIVVVEQHGNQTFNKGRLMNSAFKNILKLFPNHNCVVFHDVDLVPEDDRNLYTCGLLPKHMSPGVSKFNYTLPYYELIGGVLAITVQQYIQLNGYSNVYWGWGGEDDDMFYRMKYENLGIIRPPQNLGRYTMMYHKRRTWISHSNT